MKVVKVLDQDRVMKVVLVRGRAMLSADFIFFRARSVPVLAHFFFFFTPGRDRC
jgi:hypothetical protein